MDGVLIDLLNAKWKTFVKTKFYKQFFTFAFYFLTTLICFTLRPGPPLTKQAALVNNTNITLHNTHGNSTDIGNSSVALNYTLKQEIRTNLPHASGNRICLKHKSISIHNIKYHIFI